MKDSYLNDEFFSRLETLSLNLRKDLTGFFGGKHLVRTYGQTVEFADYREYMLGDDIRRIDWNLYSRFEKYFLKLFTDEQQMKVQIFLDCSASMGKPDGKKASYAVAMAAALGFLAVQNMDKLEYDLIKGGVAEDPFGIIVGKNSFFRAVGELEKIDFDGEVDLCKAITDAPTGTGDGLSVVISDFFTENDWKKAVDFLRYKNRQVLLIQILTPEEIDPSYTGRVNLIDSESEELTDERNMKLKITRGMLDAYRSAMSDMQSDMRSFCASREAAYFCINTAEPIERAVFTELFGAGLAE